MVGYPRVTHPSATKFSSIRKFPLTPFDLHVLGTPPACDAEKKTVVFEGKLDEGMYSDGAGQIIKRGDFSPKSTEK